MTYSKCEQCGHRFDFDETNETQACPECQFETRLFPVPRPERAAPTVPRGTIPFDIPVNRSSAPRSIKTPDRTWSYVAVAVVLVFMVALVLGGDSIRDLLFFVGGLILGGLIYFMPAIIAHNHEHPNAPAITVLNFVAGWTFVGWVAALVWAYTNRTPARR